MSTEIERLDAFFRMPVFLHKATGIRLDFNIRITSYICKNTASYLLNVWLLKGGAAKGALDDWTAHL